MPAARPSVPVSTRSMSTPARVLLGLDLARQLRRRRLRVGDLRDDCRVASSRTSRSSSWVSCEVAGDVEDVERDRRAGIFGACAGAVSTPSPPPPPPPPGPSPQAPSASAAAIAATVAAHLCVLPPMLLPPPCPRPTRPRASRPGWLIDRPHRAVDRSRRVPAVPSSVGAPRARRPARGRVSSRRSTAARPAAAAGTATVVSGGDAMPAIWMSSKPTTLSCRARRRRALPSRATTPSAIRSL